MYATAKSINEDNILHIWAKKYLLRDMNRLQKRLFDWWTGEGFFYVSGFSDEADGMCAELMLMLGESACRMIGENEGNSLLYAADEIEKKKADGWEMISSDYEGYYYLLDTENNRQRVKELLGENIRNFELLNFNTVSKHGVETLKSVSIRIYSKEQMAE